MKSIGEHLRTAREEKGYSFDQVVHDTNISKEYIHALEEDDFDFFPAEAYLIGFLRNYSEYLTLDPAKMVEIYKNFKISEEPVPMDLLLGKKKAAPEKKEKVQQDEEIRKGLPKWVIPMVAMVIIAVGAALVFLPSFLGLDNEDAPEPVVEDSVEVSTSPKEFFLTEDTLDITVSSGDRIKVSTGSELFTFLVTLSSEVQSLSYTDKDGVEGLMSLVPGEEKLVILDEENGVYFSIKDVSETTSTLIAQKVAHDEEPVNSEATETAEASTVAAAAERTAEKIVITTESYPQTYEIDVFFRGGTLFRYEPDGQAPTERYFQAEDRLKFDVNRSCLLWASNAGNLDIKISGEEISIGENGQVVVRSVKWVKNDESGKYDLTIVPYN